MEKESIVLQRTNGSAQRLGRQGRVALSVDTHQLWHSSSGIEIKFEYVSGHLPANCFTEEIEIKDRVAIMLFKLKPAFLYPRDATAINPAERINISIVSGYCRL